jgi:hypothetical protein
MPRLTKAALQKHLQHLEKEELIAQLLQLFGKFKMVNEHFQMEYGEDTQEVVNAYKHKIRKAYFSNRRIRRPRTASAKKLITEFKKVALFEYDIIDLLLFRVENSIEFADKNGYMSDAFYKSILSAFGEAIQLMSKSNLTAEFKDRCEKSIWFAGELECGLNYPMQDMLSRLFVKESL